MKKTDLQQRITCSVCFYNIRSECGERVGGGGGGGVVVSPLSMSFTLTILCLSYAQTIGGWGEHTRTDKGGKGKATSGGFVLCSR